MPSHDQALAVPAPAAMEAGAERLLLAIARASIRHGLATGGPMQVRLEALPESLRATGASFVTLHLEGALRGCVGRLEADRPLALDVAGNAFEAAFRDRRFEPVRAGEADRLEISLSLLGPLQPIRFDGERDLARQLVPGRDGVVLRRGGRHATFLPEVWQDLSDPARFLAKLRAKGGLGDGWEGVEAWRYVTRRITGA